jgi:hypothetical protein
LLSKADLLTAQDRSQVIEYVRNHVKKELTLNLTVHAVSVMTESRELLTRWFEEEIAPLYSQRQELKIRSIRRKLGALRQSVELALRGRLWKGKISPKRLEHLRVVEAELRQASGRLEEMKKIARHAANELGSSSSLKILQSAGASLVEAWSLQNASSEPMSELVRNSVTQTIQDQTEALRRRMDTSHINSMRLCKPRPKSWRSKMHLRNRNFQAYCERRRHSIQVRSWFVSGVQRCSCCWGEKCLNLQ